MKQLFEAYIEESALKKAFKHFTREAERGVEGIGFLVGKAFRWKGKAFVLINEFATGESASTGSRARFSSQGIAEAAKELKSGEMIVGWTHSHLSIGCFMSATDIETQEKFFPEEYLVALVIDPVRGQKKFFKLEDGKCREASYAVVKKKRSEEECRKQSHRQAGEKKL